MKGDLENPATLSHANCNADSNLILAIVESCKVQFHLNPCHCRKWQGVVANTSMDWDWVGHSDRVDYNSKEMILIFLLF